MLRRGHGTRALILGGWALGAVVCLAGAGRADGGLPEGAPPAPGHEKTGDTPPAEVQEEVSIDPPPGARVPLDLRFVDQDGRELALRELFRGDLPVLLNLVYYRCPSMCGVVLEQQLQALKALEWSPGREFRIVTVSINPHETPRLAVEKRATFLAELGRPGAEQGWTFLTGNEQPIQSLAGALGFRYRFDLRTREYAHAAGLFVCTPDGTLSRVLYGVDYDPRTLRLSLVEAGQGKVGTVVDRLILFCYHFDPGTGRYTAEAMNVMRLAGLATVVLLGSYLAAQHARRPRATPAAAPTGGTPAPGRLDP